MVEAASPWRRPVLGGTYGAKISLTGACDGDEGDLSSRALRESHEGGEALSSQGAVCASGDPSSHIPP